MKSIIRALGPYAKAVVLIVALLVAVAAEAAGVDVGLQTDEVWKMLGAAVLVFAVPNRTDDQ